MSNVYTKLMEARLKLQNTELHKSGYNKFAGYKYFELGDFLPSIQTIFREVGLCGIVSYTEDLATLTITDGTDSIVITSPMGSAALKGCHEVQNIGAVETYQRRYLWVTAMEIVEHDVLDAVTGTDTGNAVKKPSGVTPTAGAGKGLTDDVKQHIQDEAIEIIADIEMSNSEAAYDRLTEASKDESGEVNNDYKVYAWSLLPSNVRSAITKHINSLKDNK